MRVLVVEDDEALREGLTVGLSLHAITADGVARVEEARLALAMDAFDAVVLDLMLPDGSGLDLLARLREGDDPVPVLVLTARDNVSERISGLDLGADDYMGKPFDLDELAARLRAIARRSVGRASGKISFNGLTLDPARMTGDHEGRPLAFTRREFAILAALIERPGQILPRRVLEERLYGWQEEIESNAVEVHVHHLRSKLGSGFIETVRGIGYRLREKP